MNTGVTGVDGAEAARSGDLVTEALALFNAAWLNGEGGRGREAATQVADLAKLLRDHLDARLVMPSSVAAPRRTCLQRRALSRGWRSFTREPAAPGPPGS